MNGFRVWVDGPQGTTVLVLAMLAAGFMLGWYWALRPRRVSRRVRRELAARAEERAALRWVRRVGRPPELHHEADPEHAARLEAMAARRHPVFREKRTSTAAFLDRQPWVVPDGQVAHEAWVAHSEHAMDLANGVTLAPEDEAVLAGINARLDEWLVENIYGGEA